MGPEDRLTEDLRSESEHLAHGKERLPSHADKLEANLERRQKRVQDVAEVRRGRAAFVGPARRLPIEGRRGPLPVARPRGGSLALWSQREAGAGWERRE